MSDIEITNRLDPDILLSTITKKKTRSKGGKLHLFIGMAPGVGKTYAMLLAGQEAKRSANDIVVGVVESHGRKETEQLIKGLEIIPKKKLIHRDIEFSEMDIDAILERRPGLVLVDELAHSNIPGSRHAKRWQDVFELLDAGIDVYSTMNVQHLESRKESVEKITQITIAETVPDVVLDRASQIQLIDLSVQDLLRRLKEGKVYLGEKADFAAENFFKEEKLTALREIALRVAAERVDTELQAMSTEKDVASWGAADRLMVAIGFSSTSETLIRAARKMAYNLDANWIAVHITTNELATEEEKSVLKKNLELARNLGAEVITLSDTHVVDALVRIARQKDITQIIIGRSKRKWLADFFGQASLHEQLIEKSSLDITVLGPRPQKTNKLFEKIGSITIHSTGASLIKAMISSLMMLGLSALLAPLIGYRSVGFLLLLGILSIGLFLPLGSVLFASILLMSGWNIFFIPPIGTLAVKEPEDIFLCISFFVAALATGILTRRIKFQQEILVNRELRVQAINQILLDIATATTTQELRLSALHRIASFFHGSCDLILRNKDNSLSRFLGRNLALKNESRELAVAKWAMDNNKAAGHFTETLSSADALYIPLQGSYEMMGVLAFQASKIKELSLEDVDLFFLVARQIAIHLERQKFRTKALESTRLAESEKLHQRLLEIVMQEIKDNSAKNHDYAKLIFATENFLLVSRLIVGVFPLKKEPWTSKGIINLAIATAQRVLGSEDLKLSVIDDGQALQLNVEQESLVQSLATILVSHCLDARQSEILIELKNEKVIIAHLNPEIAEENWSNIFDLFAKSKNHPYFNGLLGVWLVKAIVKAHEGKFSLESNSSSGLTLSIELPKG